MSHIFAKWQYAKLGQGLHPWLVYVSQSKDHYNKPGCYGSRPIPHYKTGHLEWYPDTKFLSVSDN